MIYANTPGVRLIVNTAAYELGVAIIVTAIAPSSIDVFEKTPGLYKGC